MNGFTEPLPGLLDDPQFQIPNLPSLPDVHIAPLRNPAPSRHANVPAPLEPFTKPPDDHRHGARTTTQLDDETERSSLSLLRPSDVLSAREAKKPHLAISELLETSNSQDADTQQLQLPSFVSLAVVERSPTQLPSLLNPHKRLRVDVDIPTRDVGRRLPRPAQKDDKQPRPVPLLPAMVTGLHEPPPSAGILPSMDLDERPSLARTNEKSKMKVKDILAEARKSTHVPPEAMLNTPDLPNMELPKPNLDDSYSSSLGPPNQAHEELDGTSKKDQKTRRARRKWTDGETAYLVAGVKKHGAGKWKQILTDPLYIFDDRTSIDLKDRYRVYLRDQPDTANTSTIPTYNKVPSNVSNLDTDLEPTIEPGAGQAVSAVTEATKAKRRRRHWTSAEDAELMRGVAKHGYQWTMIHDDPELDLKHRRATDLRDRVRNLDPEGYKQADARPLKNEAKNDLSPKVVHRHESTAQIAEAGPSTNANAKVAGKRRATAHVTAAKNGGETTQATEQTGVKLPPLALDDGDELDWGDNTLAPLLEWDDIGM